MGIELNEQQVFGVFDMEQWWHKSSNQLFEVSGPAGTGKTTLVRYFIDRIGLKYDEVAFVAYMGKAASQLARTGLPATTIHHLIYTYEKVVARDNVTNKIIFKANGSPMLKGQFVLKERLPKKIKLIVVDEGSTVEASIAKDLLSFGIPVVVLGDLNQLPPVFGQSYFLRDPNFVLTQIMRQAEGNPIIWLSQQVLAGNPLQHGVYKNSAVINKSELNDFNFTHSDIVLTGTNKLRFAINNLYREKFNYCGDLKYPHVGEKIICRRNNRNHMIDDMIFLTNGTAGTVSYIDTSSVNGKQVVLDFKPDFSKHALKNLKVDYKTLMANTPLDDENKVYNPSMDLFEYGYAQTVHLSQGSQYPNVLFLNEQFLHGEDYKRFLYTAITRASETITIVQ